jgi:hypothetical protein
VASTAVLGNAFLDLQFFFIIVRLLFDKICEQRKLWHYVYLQIPSMSKYLRPGISIYLVCLSALAKQIKEFATLASEI